jgi:hypothetical protein
VDIKGKATIKNEKRREGEVKKKNEREGIYYMTQR